MDNNTSFDESLGLGEIPDPAMDEATGAYTGADISSALSQPSPALAGRVLNWPGKKGYLDDTKSLWIREGITELVYNTRTYLSAQGQVTEDWNNLYNMLVYGYEDANGDL